MFFVYVIQNPHKRLYVGYTADLDHRIRTHQTNQGGWTRNRGPWKLVYYEMFTNRTEALRREKNLKVGPANQRLRSRVDKKRTYTTTAFVPIIKKHYDSYICSRSCANMP